MLLSAQSVILFRLAMSISLLNKSDKKSSKIQSIEFDFSHLTLGDHIIQAIINMYFGCGIEEMLRA